ncbi:DUF6644 family protein [Steroidobacter flavus]|uniref:DUF6644 family protein n=1 Tax=Steroidobacter flavus TaxID=1842136 RepID=A0ABV8SJW4_9GAMM
MTTTDILSWLQDSALAHTISKTDHLVGAGLQIIHVMGLVALLASLVLISLHLVGLAFKNQPITDIAKEATKLVWVGLTLTALSGTLMFIATPKLYFYNPAFRLKMILFFVAVIVQLALFRKTASQQEPSPAFARASVGISLAAWFSVAMAGRMIGFI